MTGPLGVGVIGLGFFGSRHARCYAAHPAARLVAVCDADPNRCRHWATDTGAEAVADYAALLARDDIDAVSVCLPDRLHEAAALAAVRSGKAVLLEKPLAHDAATAGRIVEAAEAARARLMVGHILRLDPRYAAVYAASAPERLGQVIHVRAERAGIRRTASRLGADTSILFYMGVHDVDAMQWIARCPIRSVFARKRSVLNSGNEDCLFAIVEFENRAIGSIGLSWAWPDGLMNGYLARFEIVGTRSAAYMDCSDQGAYSVGGQGTEGADTHLWPEIDGRIAGDLATEIDHFVAATLAGTPYVQPLGEAFAAVPVLDALRESAETGAPVEIVR